MFQRIRTRGLVAILAGATAVPAAAAPAQAQRYEISGREIAIYNLAGEVTVRAGNASAVVVQVTTGGRDAGRLTVETGPIGRYETLRVIYPSDRVVYPDGRSQSRTDVSVRPDGTFGYGNDDRWRGRGRDRVRVSTYGDGLEAYADLDIAVPPGQRIAVALAVGEISATNVNGHLVLDTQAAPVSATGIRGSLTVDVGSGAVDVRDVEGDVNIDTGSGGVDVTGVNGRDLLVDTGSGRVEASEVSVSDLNIDTGSGSIRASRVTARSVRLDTGSGSIELEASGDLDRIEIDTGSGGVTVTVPESYGARVVIDTGSGAIDLDMPLQLQRWERTYVSGTIGDGRGRLTIDTGSGSVRLRSGG